jgi:alpha-beta hydrolase superfamily lysophospholipase
MHRHLFLALVILSAAVPAQASGTRKVDWPLRGRDLTLTVYDPSSAPKGTVLMGSGDVGWVGLGVSMAEDLSAQGYRVVGINVRQYLAAFTDRQSHLGVHDVPQDYRDLSDLLKRSGLLGRPVIVSGVSEGAGLAVLAAADPKNHDWIDGVIAIGLPPTAELAWRWTDAASWITKRDPEEPSFTATDFLAGVSPVPLVMIQSTKDEYVSEQDYRRYESVARPPRKLVLINASNHRFTDRRAEVRAAYFDALAWIREAHP